MLEKIDFAVDAISKEEYKPLHDALMQRLVILQQQARSAGVGVVVLLEGWNGAGKGGRISDLLFELDARATTVHVTENFNVKDAKLFRNEHYGATGYFPLMQEFWKALGPRGNMTLLDRGWYTTAAQRLMYAKPDKDASRKQRRRFEEALGLKIDAHIESIENFEAQLIADGYVVVKFFLHIPEETQRARLTGLAKDPATAWRVSKEELSHVDDYANTYQIYENMLCKTNFGFAPWVLLNGQDKRRSNLTIVRTLVESIETALHKQADPATAAASVAAFANAATAQEEGADERTRTPQQQAALRAAAQLQAVAARAAAPTSSKFPLVADFPSLQGIDRHLQFSREEYKKRLSVEQDRLFNLELEMYQRRIPLMIMYEGWDAAGKGGNIKRVAQALDARAYTIFPSPAPTKLELLHPHLWRYWTHLPKAGHVGIYDRSWYGRVLVERVEGFASPAQWGRAYDEINEFERDLQEWGAILLKFWVDISEEEQLARFNAREADPAKQWKITPEDWRNRDRYPQYRAAVEDMFRLTSTPYAPWILLESDDKLYARIKALRIINDTLEARLHEK
ncbi:MAG: polyphosphate--AMP phosphotransferase [Raoultibacter sp.]